jgi:transcriptional regulator with XRE-family HTH domain
MDMAEAVGLAIRRVRKQQGNSQAELAWQADLDRTYISGVERGVRNPSLLSLVRIAAALDIRLSRLVAMAEQIRSARVKSSAKAGLSRPQTPPRSSAVQPPPGQDRRGRATLRRQ